MLRVRGTRRYAALSAIVATQIWCFATRPKYLTFSSAG